MTISWLVAPSEEERAQEQAQRAISEQKEREARVHAKLKAELDGNREGIIREIQELMEKGEFQLAYRKAYRFRQFDDEELTRLTSVARGKHFKQEEQNMLSELERIPESNLEAKMLQYTVLAEWNPENEGYKQKVVYYREALREENRKISVERDRIGIRPRKSDWDGSYPVVKEYLKQVANDPSSIKIESCTEVFQTKDGWRVGCDYRGKNSFGAMVLESNWFTIRNGEVVKVDSSR